MGFLVSCDELDGDHLLRDLQGKDFGLLRGAPVEHGHRPQAEVAQEGQPVVSLFLQDRP